jgi:hypothetical protein
MSVGIAADTPRSVSFYEIFLNAWPRHDPDLAKDALAVLTEDALSRRSIPPVDSETEAVRWIWEELAQIDTLEARAYLRRLAGAASTVSYERLMLEVRVRKVLEAIANEVERGDLQFTALDPRSGQRFNPDPTLLVGLAGPDRWREQIPTPNGFIKNLRFVEIGTHDLGQLTLPLEEAMPAEDATEKAKPEVGTVHSIDEAEAAYVERLQKERDSTGQAPTRKADFIWAENQRPYRPRQKTIQMWRAKYRSDKEKKRRKPDQPEQT